MNLTAFHHVGLIVESVDAVLGVWQSFGYRVAVRVTDPIQKAEIVLLARDGQPNIELVSPLSSDSPSFGWLKRIKAGAYHTCFEVTGLEATLADLKTTGFVVVMEPVPAVAFENRRVCFLWHKATGLFELLEQ